MNGNCLTSDQIFNFETKILQKYNLWSAAAFYSNKNEPIMRRAARVSNLIFSRTSLPDYKGSRLYPCAYWQPAISDDDHLKYGIGLNNNGGYLYDEDKFIQFIDCVEDPFEKRILQDIQTDMRVYTFSYLMTSRYASGGNHSVMNHARVLEEGFSGYRERVEVSLGKVTNIEEKAFYEGMLETVDGLIIFVGRCVEDLKKLQSNSPDEILSSLIEALERVPVYPARNFYEAILCANILSYIGSTEPGRIDQYLFPYYIKEFEDGSITAEEAEYLLEEYISNIDSMVGSPAAVHMTLGGTNNDGSPAYNELTKMILKIMRKHRQPNTSLRVRGDMPGDIWDIVLENFRLGCGNPALINEETYLKSLQETLNIPWDDAIQFAFAGCTETVIVGKTNVDSTWNNLNLLDILEQSIYKHLGTAGNYDCFYSAFKDDLKVTVKEMVQQVNLLQHKTSLYRPRPVETLLHDDCIENGKGFFAGGARYNFNTADIFGAANVINSLFTLKKLFKQELAFSKETLLKMLQSNYQGYELEYAQIKGLDKYGNYNDEINEISKDLLEFIFDEIKGYRCFRGNGYYLPSIIGWTSFDWLGQRIGATPDGRLQGEALADSVGPSQGTDKHGLTEMLLSTACIPQNNAQGICVLNIKLLKQSFDSPSNCKNIRSLFETYFELGGLQIQVTVADSKILKDALKNPEKYGNLCVRIGGFNDYFIKQSDAIKNDIILRTSHVYK